MPARVAQPAATYSQAQKGVVKGASEHADTNLGALQNAANSSPVTQNLGALQRMADRGLPEALKSGVEQLSGVSMDGVRVHRNSAEPAKVGAHAYAQGRDIHLGAGQENHLPHEAWHVAQQAQGRVKPTVQAKGVAINDDAGLEHEADVMGARAAVASNVAISKPKTRADTTAAPVQRKIMVDNQPYAASPKDAQEIVEAAGDTYVRHYKSKSQMTAHLVSKQPSSVGLIKPRAMWYDLPFLGTEFFVLGEWHPAVRGGHIKAASNITKPILDESLAGWNVGETGPTAQTTQDQGLEENSSKLLKALHIWKPELPAPGGGGGAGPPLPDVPDGEDSTRLNRDGSKRLIVRGNGGASEFWKQPGQQDAPPNNYDPQQEAINAIRALFARAFATEILAGTLNTIHGRLAAGREYLDQIFDPTNDFAFNGGQPKPDWQNRADTTRGILYNATKTKLEQNYQSFHDTEPGALDNQKAPGDVLLNSADDYRDEFMFAAVLRAKQSGAFAFASMGNAHLMRLKDRFKGKGIKYVTLQDFFAKHSNVAIELPSVHRDEEIEAFISDVKASKVAPTEDRILAMLDDLNKKGYPTDGELRSDLITLLGLARQYGFQDISPQKEPPSENEKAARALGFI